MRHLESRGAGEVEKRKKGDSMCQGLEESMATIEQVEVCSSQRNRVSRRETPRSQPTQNSHTRLSMTFTLKARGQQGHDKCLKRQSWQIGGCVIEGDPEVRKPVSQDTHSVQLRFSRPWESTPRICQDTGLRDRPQASNWSLEKEWLAEDWGGGPGAFRTERGMTRVRISTRQDSPLCNGVHLCLASLFLLSGLSFSLGA